MSEPSGSGDARPLHEREVTTRFGDRVADYACARPGYPPEAIDAILSGLAGVPEVVAADIGAGTGISARLLAQRGVRVIAVEPNAPMREAGQRSTGPGGPRRDGEGGGPVESGEVTWRDGRAEATGLCDASVDLVLCAQSYHWFEPASACREFGRILRRPGRLALMWNDGDESTPVASRYYDLVREASTEGTTAHQDVARRPRVEAPFGELREQHFRHTHELDLAGLIGRAMSASYVPKTGPAAERLLEGLRELHRELANSHGRVEFVYDVWVWIGELTGDRATLP